MQITIHYQNVSVHKNDIDNDAKYKSVRNIYTIWNGAMKRHNRRRTGNCLTTLFPDNNEHMHNYTQNVIIDIIFH